MESFVLRDKRLLSGFELGLFNWLTLVVLLPMFWFDYLGYNCWGGCCCGNRLALFYQGNLTRLGLIALALISLPLLELLHLRLSLQPQSQVPGLKSWLSYGVWTLLRSLPLALLLLAILALPMPQLIYAGTALLTLVLILGPLGSRFPLAPYFALVDQPEPFHPRHYLKNLVTYLGLLLLVIPTLFFTRAFACDCSKVTSVKANMNTLQTIVETYAIDWGGLYPENLDQLKAHAVKGEFWREFTNPYLYVSGEGQSYAQIPPGGHSAAADKPPKLNVFEYDRDIFGIRVHHASFKHPSIGPGMVLYERLSPGKYSIYGLRQDGSYILYQDALFILSNR